MEERVRSTPVPDLRRPVFPYRLKQVTQLLIPVSLRVRPMNKTLRVSLGLSAAAVAIVVVSAASPAKQDSLHLSLIKSAPAAEASVTALDEVRLWFSEEPQEGATSIRLVDSSGELVETADTKAGEDDSTIFHAALAAPAMPGVYRVVWRTMAADGHVVNGDFSFSLHTQ